MTGTIRTLRVDKGFGFIKDDAGKDYFFHQSAVYGEGLDNLREGDSVEFDVGEGPKGPRAENVRRTSTNVGLRPTCPPKRHRREGGHPGSVPPPLKLWRTRRSLGEGAGADTPRRSLAGAPCAPPLCATRTEFS